MIDYQQKKRENSLQLEDDVRNQRSIWSGLPEIIGCNNTTICNCRCRICRDFAAGTGNRLPAETLERFLHQLLPTAWECILTTAGEPLLDPDLKMIQDLCHYYQTRMRLHTNGMLLDLDMYRALRPDLSYMVISLDSLRAETYNRLRENGDFAAVMANLRALQRESLITAVRRRSIFRWS